MPGYNAPMSDRTDTRLEAVEAPVGQQAPDFTLEDLDGRTFTLSDCRGRAHVVLVFGNIT